MDNIYRPSKVNVNPTSIEIYLRSQKLFSKNYQPIIKYFALHVPFIILYRQYLYKRTLTYIHGTYQPLWKTIADALIQLQDINNCNSRFMVRTVPVIDTGLGLPVPQTNLHAARDVNC